MSAAKVSRTDMDRMRRHHAKFMWDELNDDWGVVQTQIDDKRERLNTLLRGEADHWKVERFGGFEKRPPTKEQRRRAVLMGVGDRKVERYDRVMKFVPELGPAMDRGQLDTITAEHVVSWCFGAIGIKSASGPWRYDPGHILPEEKKLVEFWVAELDKKWEQRNRKPATGGKLKRNRQEASDER